MRFPWQSRNQDLQRELDHHLAELTDEYVRQGHPPTEAARLARKQFGPAGLIADQCRDESPWAWLQSVSQDLSFGLRQLRQTPIVTAAAILSLALGIGANAAIFSLMNTVLWRSLPVPAPEQLQLIHWQSSTPPNHLTDYAAGSSRREGALTVADFFSLPALTAMQQAIASDATIAPYSFPSPASLAFNGRPTIAYNRPVSGQFFPVLQLQPHLGRLLRPEDDSPTATPVAVLTHRFYTSFFAADPAILGKSLRLNDRLYEIVGVLPASFYGLEPGDAVELYSPLWQSSEYALARRGKAPLNDPRGWVSQAILRLNPTSSAATLTPRLDAAFHQSWVGDSKTPGPTLRLDDGRRGLGSLSENFRQPLLVLGVLLGLVLCIACANIANLLLARADARSKEVALRISLGCSPSRLLRQFLTESAMLAFFGALASTAAALAWGRVLSRLLANPNNPVPIPVHFDFPLIAAIAGFSLATVFLFGLFPAIRASRLDSNTALKQGSGSLGPNRHKGWTAGRFLIAGQFALSLILVSTAILFTENLRALSSRNLGFESTNLLIFGLRPGTSGYTEDKLPAFYRQLEDRLASTPGVAQASLADVRPMNQGGWWDEFRAPGTTARHPVAVNTITPAYLDIFATTLIAGRNFTRADSLPGATPVAIITEDLARAVFPGESPLGRSIASANADESDPPFTIIGVAPPIAFNSMKERPMLLWKPFSGKSPQVTVVLRTSASPRAILPAVEATLRDIDPNLPLAETFTMHELMARNLQRERMFATLCAAFGALALLLSIIGLYGVMSYHASRRRTEIGVRLALGAAPASITWLVLREALLLTAAGLIAAAPALYFGATFIEKELFELEPLHPAILSASTGLLLLAALLAAWFPARRAARLHPATALRQD